MAGIKLVRFVRGRIRATCKDALNSLLSISNYNAKQPAGSFLTPTQNTDLGTTITDLRTILMSTRPR
jgi:hypothetical protein